MNILSLHETDRRAIETFAANIMDRAFEKGTVYLFRVGDHLQIVSEEQKSKLFNRNKKLMKASQNLGCYNAWARGNHIIEDIISELGHSNAT